MSSHKFTPDQLIRCIDPGSSLLEKGAIYKVAAFFEHNSRYVNLNGDGPQVLLFQPNSDRPPVLFNASRFVPADQPAAPEPTGRFPVPPRGEAIRRPKTTPRLSHLTAAILRAPASDSAELMAVQDMMKALAESARNGLNNHLSKELCRLLARNFQRLADHTEAPAESVAVTTIPVTQ